MSSIGMMDEGYFLGKKEILEWVNSTLGTSVLTIEALGKGDIYCRLISHYHPGCIQAGKIIMSPKMEHETILNLKHLQNGLEKLGIHKKIDILKVSKCKQQENIQLAQWLKRTLELQSMRSSLTKSASRSSIQSIGLKNPRHSLGLNSSKALLTKPTVESKTVSQHSQKIKQIQLILRDKSVNDQQKLLDIRQLVLTGDLDIPNPEKET